MCYRDYLKKIIEWFIDLKEKIQEWVANIKKAHKNKRSGAVNTRSAKSGWTWHSWLWRIRLGWRLILTLSIIFILAVFVANLKDCSGWGGWASDTIERKTSFVVEEIKKIAEFTSVTYYEEQLIEKTKDNSHFMGLYSTTELLAVVVSGTIRAGFDLSTITNSDVYIGEDGVLNIQLPEAKILDTIINPSDVDVVYGGENELFNDQDYKDAINRAEQQIKDHAIANDILKKATEQGENELRNLFNALGYNEVNITYK